MWTLDGPPFATPARRAATFVDDLLRRARELSTLVEFFRAHLEATRPGQGRTHAEHVADLLALGLRWRAHARLGLRRPGARPDHDAVEGLLVRLRAAGRPASEVARLAAWNDFAREECCPEALDDAVELAAWFERAAEVALGRAVPGVEAQLELVRAEVVSRALRERRLAAPVYRLGRGEPAAAPPLAAPLPAPVPAPLLVGAARRTLGRMTRAS